MKPLPGRKATLWGDEHDVIPYLIDEIHGDGKQWLWFMYMDDRPRYYVVRVDSSVVAENDNDQWSEEIFDWICNQIQEEMFEFMTEAQYDEWSEKGYLEGGRPWPIPPLEMPCGAEWGGYEPDETDFKAIQIQ